MIRQLVAAFVQVIFPVVLIGSFGYVLGRSRSIDLGPITALAVSVLVPAVVFDSLARAAVPHDVLSRLLLHVILQLVCLGVLALLAARARVSVSAAIARFVRMPITYAIAAGVVVNVAGWPLPAPIGKASQLLASGSVAVLLLMVGLQLARLALKEEAAGAGPAAALRLVAAPPIAWFTGRLIGLDGLALSVAVLQASTPTAVTAALWAMEFDTRPSPVTATVVLSTLAGVVSLTLLLAVLVGRG